MKLLIDDVIQYENKPYFVNYASPQLFETTLFDVPITIQLDKPYTIDCIGLGNCTSSQFTIDNLDGYIYTQYFDTDDVVDRNGLYEIPSFTTPFNINSGFYEFNISFDVGSRIGRIGAGKSRQLSTAEAKELGFNTNKKELRTQNGAIIPQIAGYAARVISLTVPYRITPEIYLDFKNAYQKQLSQSFPLFILFDKSEAVKFNPVGLHRFYGVMNNNFMLQTQVHEFLYSYNFTFAEAF